MKEMVMDFPKISTEELIRKLEHPKEKVRMVLDTDTYNEVDDQFALAYALRSSDRIKVERVYAAPFFNELSTGPKDGMEKSYNEILKILKLMKISREDFVFKGSEDYLKGSSMPQYSEAAKDLVNLAMGMEDDVLYVVAIGALTNIASAILIEPEIIKKIVVVWLGGHALEWPHTDEFNLMQDIYASKLIFDCGVPLVHIPCGGVTTHLLTTVPELAYHLEGKSDIADYLLNIVKKCKSEHKAWSRVIWDISAIAWLIDPDWITTALVHSPIVTKYLTWSFDSSRHFIRSATFVKRDPIFSDLFKKLI